MILKANGTVDGIRIMATRQEYYDCLGRIGMVLRMDNISRRAKRQLAGEIWRLHKHGHHTTVQQLADQQVS